MLAACMVAKVNEITRSQVQHSLTHDTFLKPIFLCMFILGAKQWAFYYLTSKTKDKLDGKKSGKEDSGVAVN